MRTDAAPFVVGQIRRVSPALHGAERRPPSRPPSTFQTVSLCSTLAIWPPNTPHRLGFLRRPLDFLRVALPPRPAKKVTLSLRFNHEGFCDVLYLHRKPHAVTVFVGSGALLEGRVALGLAGEPAFGPP